MGQNRQVGQGERACPFARPGDVLPGSLVIAVLRQVLHMPAFRYVDDVFGPEREGSAAHAEQIVARVVKCLLGPTAISSHKVAHGNPLVVLGVEATIEEEGMSFRPSADKVAKWTRQLKEALASGRLYGGEASKMCGRLSCAHTGAVVPGGGTTDA